MLYYIIITHVNEMFIISSQFTTAYKKVYNIDLIKIYECSLQRKCIYKRICFGLHLKFPSSNQLCLGPLVGISHSQRGKTRSDSLTGEMFTPSAFLYLEQYCTRRRISVGVQNKKKKISPSIMLSN